MQILKKHPNIFLKKVKFRQKNHFSFYNKLKISYSEFTYIFNKHLQKLLTEKVILLS